MQIEQLHQKVSLFFDEIQGRLGQEMSCQAGCARCCYVDLSVFKLEADRIKNWFQSLPLEAKKILVQEWERPLECTENFNGEVTHACAFLRDNRCTIYEARPLICRTQGLALKYILENQTYIDTCPLNFQEIEIELKDCLDLDRVNLILATLAGKEATRVKLSDLIEQFKLSVHN